MYFCVYQRITYPRKCHCSNSLGSLKVHLENDLSNTIPGRERVPCWVPSQEKEEGTCLRWQTDRGEVRSSPWVPFRSALISLTNGSLILNSFNLGFQSRKRRIIKEEASCIRRRTSAWTLSRRSRRTSVSSQRGWFTLGKATQRPFLRSGGSQNSPICCCRLRWIPRSK